MLSGQNFPTTLQSSTVSAGWTRGGMEFLSIVVGTPLMIVVLLGSSAQKASETTTESNQCGNRSPHDDPASSYSCLSNSLKCCRGLSSSDWNGNGDAIINYNCKGHSEPQGGSERRCLLTRCARAWIANRIECGLE